ncbi:histidine kinase N-terminal 7TM domain-containing diguanylate cyclase [Bacillus sp. SJS]|uniref:histidine kinase N-terminal 7TM domain-containing diguanylate cyclase n=1 Tax=Bacillus sp. SJS TaxID=1423321 RepID=UPI00054CD6E5|nr:histidine kinase N-terminal 7TM domain-containing protein [Bacillus sp. SJS]KZZ83490.1 hypothetical protein AS29_015930 [Bacillus sp. SJS]
MPQEIVMYLLAVILAGTLSLFLGLYALFKLKGAPGARYYVFVTLFSAMFTYSYAFELSSPSLEQIKLWVNIEYLAILFIPVFLLHMCFEYAGQRVKPWMYYALLLIPVITIFMHNTNDLHHLYYRSMGLRSDISYPILKLEWGPFFYVHSIFLFICLMMSSIILLMQLPKSILRYQIQILLMVAGLIMPIVANHFYLNGLSPEGIDLGPVSMSVSFLLHGAALLFFQMFNVAPIAREVAFESMKDGILILNNNGILVDFNERMRDTLPMLSNHPIGRPIQALLAGNPELAYLIRREQECDYKLVINGKTSHWHIRFSPVQNKRKVLVGQIITFADVTERVCLQEKLEHLASMDGLTQVYNRAFFMKNAQALLDSLIPSWRLISVIMFDIDYFKKVNDTYGHEAGDEVLTSVAGVVKGILGDKEIAGRYGGEEFIICIPDASLEDAYHLANTIREKVSECGIKAGDKEIRVTSSFGISSLQAMPGGSIKELVREADGALYAAKRNGRNCVEIFEQAI